VLNIIESNSIGKIEGPEPSAHIIALLAFLENHLSGFVIKYFSDYPNIFNEIGITQKLEMYLNPFLKVELSTFNLTKEYVEDTSSGQSPHCDLGFYLDGEDTAIFCVEAKRLPTPGSGRKKEYVFSPSGKSGGIERFKKEIHGKRLSHSAMIAYIQQNNFHYWLNEVNRWISNLIKITSCEIEWHNEDLLCTEYYRAKTAKFTSKNKRKNNCITLTHFWIDLRSPLQIKRDKLKFVKRVLRSN